MIIAYSVNPEPLIKEYEHKTPSLAKRIEALNKLTQKGWKIGLRIDPILPIENDKIVYQNFLNYLFSSIDQSHLHSTTLGSFRLPPSIKKVMEKNTHNNRILAVNHDDNESLVDHVEDVLSNLTDQKKVFRCKDLS